MVNSAQIYLSKIFLNAQREIPHKVVLQLSIEKLKSTPKATQDYHSAFHYINVLISDMPDNDPYKAMLIKKLYTPEIKNKNHAPLKITGPFITE